MKSGIIILLVLVVFSCQDKSRSKQSQIYEGPIIDMHIHAYSEGNPMFGMTHPPTLRGKTYEGVKTAEELREQTLEKFKEHKIVKAVVTNGESWITNETKDMILQASANKTVDELRMQFQDSQLQIIAELAPIYSGQSVNNEATQPYFELAQELHIPVGVHIFPGGPNYGFHFMPQMLGRVRIKNAKPLELEDILTTYPDLKLYVMHGGWPYVEDMKALMYAHPNVYVDIAVVNWILPQDELNSYLKSLIDAGFQNRILFGSDQMVWPQTIDDAVASVNSVDFLTLEQKEDIFYDNAAQFLGLSETEIQSHKDP